MDLDLHIHTNASDGTLDPAQVVSAAADANLDVIAIADHDTIAGIHPALEAARTVPIEVIPAIEMSTTHEEVELHILGYFVDPTNVELLDHAEAARHLRERRLREMVERLTEQGIEVSFSEVASAAPGRGTLGRPHLAWALVRGGHVRTFAEAFDRFIGNSHPAYIPTRLIDPVEAIALIERAGGIPIWAHPPAEHVETFLPALRTAGLRGIEVYRPRTRHSRVLALEQIAKEADLLVSGGSDWHGPDQGRLGDFRVDGAEVSRLLEAGGM